MAVATEVTHGDPLLCAGWDSDALTVSCACGWSVDLRLPVGVWQVLRAWVDHEVSALEG
jgi:hypothetical protein